MIAVYYDANALFIDGRPEAIPAGTLTAFATGDLVTVTSIHDASALVAAPYTLMSRQDGSPFTSATDCIAYLAGQFAMRRSLDIPSATGVASADFVQGTPLAMSRANGRLIAARADTCASSLVIGFADADIAAGFVGNATRNPVTLSDWTAVAGSPALATGQPYFLAPTGGMTLTAPASPASVCSVRLGIATTTQTFLFLQSYPIGL